MFLRTCLITLLSLNLVAAAYFSIDLEQTKEVFVSTNNKFKWQGAVQVNSNNSNVVFLYSGVIGLGTPAQNFIMYFDSGSDLTWVRSDSCTLPVQCLGKPSYKSSLSSSYQQPPNIVKSNIPYVDGTVVSGTVVTDVVSTAGSSVLSTFIQVNKIVGDPQADGILGLSLTSSFLIDVLKSNTLTSAIFSYYIEEKDAKGSLTLGAVNTARYTAPLQWIPLTEADGITPAKVFWSANMIAIKVSPTVAIPGGAQYAITAPGMSTVFDTGSSLAIFQVGVTDQIHSTLPHTKIVEPNGQTKYRLVNCSSLPDITLSFAGAGGVPVDMTFTWKEYTFLQGTPAQCVSGIVGASEGQVANLKNVGGIIGNVLLRRYISVFDLGNLRYGFSVANRAANIKPVLGSGGFLSDPAQALKNVKTSGSRRQEYCIILVVMLGILSWSIL